MALLNHHTEHDSQVVAEEPPMSKPVPFEAHRSTVSITASERHDLLANERRRVAVDVLTEEGSMPLEELATAVVDRRQGSTDGEIIERAKTTLHHVHLPKMVDIGVIYYDPDTKRVQAHRISG